MARMGKTLPPRIWEQINPAGPGSKSFFIRAIRAIRGSLLRISGSVSLPGKLEPDIAVNLAGHGGVISRAGG